MDKIEQPYFVYPMVERLKVTTDREERSRLKTLIAVNVGRPEALRELFGLDSESLAGFYPDERGLHLTTDATIDSFLERFCGGSVLEGSPEEDPLESLLAATSASTDYFASLESGTREEDIANTSADTPIEPEVQDTSAEPSETVVNSGSLTEGFARILIKNGNYTKALEIIEELYLKNPKKSVYFADQMRFLRKLIANSAQKE